MQFESINKFNYVWIVFLNHKLAVSIWPLNMKLFFQIGEAAKLKPMEVELKRLEDLSEDIVKDFSLMRKREEEMRSTNGEPRLQL